MEEQMYGYDGREGKEAILHTTLNSDSLLAELDRKLSGVVITEDPKTNELRVQQVTKPLLNKQGRASILMSLSFYGNKETKLSNIDKDEQEAMINGITSNIILTIAQNGDKWGVEFSRYDDIVDMVGYLGYLALSRGLGGLEIEHVYTDSARQTINQLQQQRTQYSEEKKSIWGRNNQQTTHQETNMRNNNY